MDMRLVGGSVVVLALAATGLYLWIDRDGDDLREAAALEGSTDATLTAPAIANDTPAEALSQPRATAAGVDADSTRHAGLPLATDGPPAGELAIQWAESNAESHSARALELREMLVAGGMLDRSLIPGDPAYDGSIAHATPIELQERFATEARDQAWARAAERQAEQFLESHPFRRVYGSLALECKATLCRFAAVADGATLMGSGRAADWQQLMHELERASGSRELWSYHRNAVMTRDEHPGQIGFVTWLRRRPPPPPDD